MNNYIKITLIVLSLQLTIEGIVISKLSYDLGFSNGRIKTLTTFAPDDYTKGGSK